MATALGAGLTWYRLFWIPGQQQYLNERNSRILSTITQQIASKVDHFDASIDNAMDFWWSNETAASVDFPSYVKLFTPDLEVTSIGTGGSGSIVKGDPPRIVVRRSEGKNYLYLGYKHATDDHHGNKEPEIEARSDIEAVVRPYFEARTEFEALILADADGRAIAQYSPSGFRLERVDKLDFAPTGTSGQQAQNVAFDGARLSGQVMSVTIGEVPYKFYAQPVVLSLMAVGPDGKEQAAEWTLCGLVRADRFGAASLAIAPNYWLLFVEALLVICLGVPILKVHVLKSRERFHATDGAWVTATTFLLAGLITVLTFDAYYFSYRFRGQIDSHLRSVAASLTTNLQTEMATVRDEVDKFQTRIERSKETALTDAARVSFRNGAIVCHPVDACKTRLLADEDTWNYPFFDLVTWTSIDGDQRIKWSTSKGITPFINLRNAKLEYFDELERANLATSPGIGHVGPLASGVSVIRSPNTGNHLTVLWEALGGGRPLTGVSLAMKAPLSVSMPVLPRRVNFAVVDASGKVMYHSDPTRSLTENFFQEAENDARLRGAIQGRQSLSLTAQYLGATQRLFVTPLPLAGAGIRTAAVTIDPGWSLAVFQPVEVPDTVNLEALIMTATMFTLYCVVLAMAWGVAVLLAPSRAKKWFWPDHTKAVQYRQVAATNLGLTAVFLLAVARLGPGGVVLGAFALAAVGLTATFAIVTRRPVSPANSARWQRDFLAARGSFLLIAAAVPAMACFQAAFTLETDVLVRRGQLHFEVERQARRDRIRSEVIALGLCGPEEREPCAKTSTFMDRRAGSQLDVYEAPFFESITRSADGPASTGTPAPGWLHRFMAFTHVALSDEAADLGAALLGSGSMDSRWWWPDRDHVSFLASDGVTTSRLAHVIQANSAYLFVASAAAAGIWLLFRFGVVPMFLLDLYVRPGFKGARHLRCDGNLLLVGPPGAAKTTRLRANNARRVFDIRTETCDLTTAEKHDEVGVDHLEHALDEASLREPVLAFLEHLTYRPMPGPVFQRRHVWIATTREPLDHLRERSAANLERWSALFQSFRKETVGLAIDAGGHETLTPFSEDRRAENPLLHAEVLRECAISQQLLKVGAEVLKECPPGTELTAEDVLTEICVAAEPYYRALWATFSREEKLALHQLAAEGVVNPTNGHIVARLLLSGVVRRDPTFRIMNETFRRFVLRIMSPDTAKTLEREGVEMPWSTYAMSAAAIAAALAAVLFLTQQQLLDAWIGYVPAMVPAATLVGRLLAGVRGPAASPAPEMVDT